MKTILLAAGRGTRLRPLTDSIPKCLVPIGGRPLLEIWLDCLGKAGVSEVLVNTHYLAGKMVRFAKTWTRSPRLQLAHEPTLLGSAGTLRKNWPFAAGDESVLVCNADNLTDLDFSAMLRFHAGHDGVMTMALFRSPTPESCGCVELDHEGRVVGFEEKPERPRSSLVNGGVYLMRAGIRDLLPEHTPADIGFDLLPRCIGTAFGWQWKGFFMDIGTPETYSRAQDLWPLESPRRSDPGDADRPSPGSLPAFGC